LPLIEENLPALKQAVEECLSQQQLKLVIDLQKAAVADSKGLEYLLDARDSAEARGGSLKLANPNPLMNEIIMATRLHQELEVFFDLERAGRSFV
jgi:anti-anti-sigma factor